MDRVEARFSQERSLGRFELVWWTGGRVLDSKRGKRGDRVALVGVSHQPSVKIKRSVLVGSITKRSPPSSLRHDP